jgi:aspartate kinase
MQKLQLKELKINQGVAASIFKPLSQNLINVDMVVQNISLNGKGNRSYIYNQS